MNILFVCSANKDRSKTAEDLFSEKYPEMDFLSAGTNHKICEQEGTNPLTEELLAWADKILVMEQKHLDWIRQNASGKYGSKTFVLSIEDKYNYYQKELLAELNKKTKKYFI